ncbi:MAG: hypothetical protein M1826_003506 [Phylliscum demangeonii]|nr:MAG: hypothetical protein M1826_003506 [Phylliscum demangeonii]
MNEAPSILRPIPRRAFDLAAASAENSMPGTPAPPESTAVLEARPPGKALAPSRDKSLLNLTSSTLFGIFAPTSSAERDEPPTPSSPDTPLISGRTSFDSVGEALPSPSSPDGERATIPRTKSSTPHGLHVRTRDVLPSLVLRVALLFVFGVAYGVIVGHLHDEHQVAPVPVEGINRSRWPYLVFWGAAGVGLGSLLPWVDLLWEENMHTSILAWPSMSHEHTSESSPRDATATLGPSPRPEGVLKGDWNSVVRSIGAFIGIAYAIRKLPWQSTLQVSLTLALVNPALWYLIDRSKPGFILSTFVGLAGTALLMGVNPAMVPAPATASPTASAGTRNAAASFATVAGPNNIAGMLCLFRQHRASAGSERKSRMAVTSYVSRSRLCDLFRLVASALLSLF